MPPQQRQSASANGARIRQESRRSHLRRGHPATMTVPRGNGTENGRETRKSVERLNGVLGH